MSKKNTPGVESGKLKFAKRAAGVLLIVSVSVAVTIILMRMNAQGDNSNGVQGEFIVKLDTNTGSTGKTNHFGISTKPTGASSEESSEDEVKVANDGVYVLSGDALGNAWPTTNSVVRQHYNDLIEEKGYSGGLSGSANFTDEKTNQPAALIYTFYLNNTSEDEAQPFRLAARLNHDRGQSATSTGVDAYEYLRLALYMGDNGQEDDDVRYFANKTMQSIGLESDHDDYRECLSAYDWSPIDSGGNRYRKPAYSDVYAKPDPISICEAFAPDSDPAYADRGLFDVDGLEIAPGASRRITFLAYLEASDPDCTGAPPTNQKLGFSLHVGL